jgi:hypothetical protein
MLKSSLPLSYSAEYYVHPLPQDCIFVTAIDPYLDSGIAHHAPLCCAAIGIGAEYHLWRHFNGLAAVTTSTAIEPGSLV